MPIRPMRWSGPHESHGPPVRAEKAPGRGLFLRLFYDKVLSDRQEKGVFHEKTMGLGADLSAFVPSPGLRQEKPAANDVPPGQ